MLTQQLSIFDLLPQSEAVTLIQLNPKRAEKLRALADKMQPTIDRKLNPVIANCTPTARRTRIAAAINQEGEKLQQIQGWLYSMADDAESGKEPKILQTITTKKQLELLYDLANYKDKTTLEQIFKSEHRQEQAQTLQRAGINNLAQLQITIAALQGLTQPKKQDPIDLQIKRLERDLVGSKIPGYFNTPAELCQRMVKLAQIKPADKVLEPSAGKGTLASAIRNAGAIAHCCELNSQLQEIIKLKGFELVASDVMEYSGYNYKSIVMNPPFDYQIEHILHCFDNLLADDGRLVTITSETIEFRTGKKYNDFRQFLADNCVLNESLPDETFRSSDNPTNVKTRLLVVQK